MHSSPRASWARRASLAFNVIADHLLLIGLRPERASATVLQGTPGFGASSVIHTSSLIELSSDLPVVIEVVEDQAHVGRLLPILDEMITGGALVSVEKVRVLKYGAGPDWNGIWLGVRDDVRNWIIRAA